MSNDRDDFVLDFDTQERIPIPDIPDHVPPKYDGTKMSVKAAYRWVNHGSNDIGGTRVPLPALKFGKCWYTTREALDWWFRRLRRKAGTVIEREPDAKRSDRASKKLDAIGV